MDDFSMFYFQLFESHYQYCNTILMKQETGFKLNLMKKTFLGKKDVSSNRY